MAKLVLTNLGTLDGSTVTTINNNNDAIEAALEKTLTRDGTSPNAMSADLDMNSNQILNLPEAVDPNDPVRKQDMEAFYTTLPAGPVGPQGPPGQDGAGSGDVVGPASAVNNNLAAFDTTTGKLIKDSGLLTSSILTSSSIGSSVQAYDADLTTWAGLSPSANFQTMIPHTFAQMRTDLGLVIGTDVQAFDSDLSAIAALSTTGLIRRTGTGTADTVVYREVLSANRSYFVDGSLGNDSNTGLASGASAFATIQKAIDTVGSLDVSIYDVTISIASGTYTASLTLKNFVGAGSCTFTCPSGTATVSTTSSNAILGNNIGSSYVVGTGIKLQTTTSGSCINLTASKLTIGACEFGACASAHIIMDAGCNVGTNASYTISGGANWHIYNSMSNFFYLGGTTITLTGTPAFATRFYYGVGASAGRIVSVTFSGSATGQRYFVDQNSHLYINNGTLPGSTAGVRQGGGVVDTLGGGGINTIESGSLGTGATLTISNIPQDYSYLVLEISGASSDTTTRQLYVTANADTTAGNYPGRKVTGTTFTAKTVASLIESTTVTNAQTFDATINIFNYQAGPRKRIIARVVANAVEYEVTGSFVSGSAVTSLEIKWDASGNFDAGTYALYGVA